MRLWHQALLPKLPRQQLLGQHRECAALRGAGWGKRHATVNYVFDHNPYKLYLYHQLVMQEMAARGYKPDASWFDPRYRGKIAEPWEDFQLDDSLRIEGFIYEEHDGVYMQECLDNLLQKGVVIESEKRTIADACGQSLTHLRYSNRPSEILKTVGHPV